MPARPARPARLALPLLLLALLALPTAAHANATVTVVANAEPGLDAIHVAGGSGADTIYVSASMTGVLIQVGAAESLTNQAAPACVDGPLPGSTLDCDLAGIELVRVYAGAGNDRIEGGSWSPLLQTRLEGNQGADLLVQTPDSVGVDRLNGGGNFGDTVSYLGSSIGVSMTNDNVANDGRGCRLASPNLPGATPDAGPCEGDFIGNTFDTFIGTTANDVIVGGPGTETIGGDGTSNDDGGDDYLDGGGGWDTVRDGAGSNVLLGGSGDDIVDARNGLVDIAIDCGVHEGIDRVYFDTVGAVDPSPVDCELRNPPKNLTLPATPSATPAVASELSSSTGTWDVDPLTPITQHLYQWRRCNVEVTVCSTITAPDGSGDARYTPTIADVGSRLQLRVTARNINGNTAAYSLPSGIVPAPILDADVRPKAPTGVAARGFEIASDHGTWTGVGDVTYEYRWQRCDAGCADIAGADAADATYTVTTEDIGHTLRLKVTATDDQTTVSETSNKTATVPNPPENTQPPSGPSGEFKIGRTLTVGQGNWSGIGAGTTYLVQWYRCDPLCNTEITSAKGSFSYKLDRPDVGHELFVRVRATDPAHGISDAFSALTPQIADYTAPSGGLVTFDKPMRVGNTLTARATFDGDVTDKDVRYEWWVCDYDGPFDACKAQPPVSTTNQYRLGEADFGRRLMVDAIAKNDLGERRQSTLQGRILRDVSPNCAGLDPNGDPDGDKLKTSVECWILTAGPKDGTLELGQLGADPLHKDIFVEVDYMKGHGLMDTSVERIMKAFAAAPVENPDGTTGINIHIDNGPHTPIGIGNDQRRWGFMSDSEEVTHYARFGGMKDGEYDWSSLDRMKNEWRKQDPIRRYAFHYLLSAHRYGTDDNESTGIARAANFTASTLGQDFIMTMGAFEKNAKVHNPGTENGQVGTFMHELGHLLGLGHGGRPAGTADHENYKPNHPSVMNYAWQLSGVKKLDGTFVFDYSRYGSSSLNTLDENSLDERVGLSAKRGAEQFFAQTTCLTTSIVGTVNGNVVETRVTRHNRAPGDIDWNCSHGNKRVELAPVKFDVNRDANDDRSPGAEALSVLRPSNDWAGIIYSGGAIGSAGASPGGSGEDGVSGTLVETEAPYVAPRFTADVDEDSTPAQLLPSMQAATGDTAAPKVTVGMVRRVKGRRQFQLTVVDNRRLAFTTVRIGAKLALQVAETGKRSSRAVVVPRGRHVVVVTARDEVGNVRTLRKVVAVK